VDQFGEGDLLPIDSDWELRVRTSSAVGAIGVAGPRAFHLQRG
jgi:hypothetical protein